MFAGQYTRWRKIITGALALLVYPFLGYADTVTLYAVVPTSGVTVHDHNSYSISVEGVNSQGQTTYAEDIIQSLGYGYPTSGTNLFTTTLPAQTWHATVVQDATVQLFTELPASGDGVGAIRSCSIGTNGKGVCVEQFWVEGGSTFTSSFTGTLVPYYTLTNVAVANSTPTAPTTTNTTNTTSTTTTSSDGVATYQYARTVMALCFVIVVSNLFITSHSPVTM